MLSSMLLFISGQDTIVILVIALFLFGGKKLPELARGLGQGIREFKDASEGVKRDIQDQINREVEKKETPAASTPPAEPQQPAAPANPPAFTNHPGATPVQDTNFHAEQPETPAPDQPVVNHPRETPL